MKVVLRALVLPAIFLSACMDDSVLEPDGPANSMMSANVTISGQLVSPDGVSICATTDGFVNDSYVNVYAPNGSGGWNQIATANVSCHVDGVYAISVPAGDGYRIGGEFYTGEYSPYPNRWLDRRAFNARSDLTRNAIVRTGRVLGGRALMKGQPVYGAQVVLSPADAEPWPWGTVAHFTTDVNGEWRWWNETAMPLVQRGVNVTATCSDVLGGRLLTAPTTFNFPADVWRFNCRYEPSTHERTTHRGTRLVMTMYPGMIGTNQDDLSGGYGWGAQLVPSVGAAPSHVTYHSNARDVRFVFSVNGQLVTTGGDGMLQLAPSSHLESTGPANVSVSGASRRVLFDLADPVSGLQMRQVSFDGTGGDYVLVQLRLSNQSASDMVLQGGIGADFGINGGGSMDGAVSLGGRLSYMRDHYVNRFIGTVLLGADLAPRTFISIWGSREVEDGLRIIEGELINETATATAAPQLFHTASFFTLRPGQARSVWVAFVGGTSVLELEANAQAAAADYTARTGMASGL